MTDWRGKTPKAALSRLDFRLFEVLAWSEVIKAVGSAPDMVDPRGMSLVGSALCAVAEALRDNFQILHEAFALTPRGE